jgi:acyl carrier protein
MDSPTLTNLIELLADFACVEPASIGMTDTLADIGIEDSLDHAQIISEIEEQFEIEIPEDEAPTLTTIAALHDAIIRAQDIA